VTHCLLADASDWDSPNVDYAALESWLFHENLAHDRLSTCVALGQNGSFFAASNEGHRWQKIPEGASDYYQKFTTITKFISSRVNTIDLGYDGTFLGIGVDNTWFYDLGTAYPALDSMIKQKGLTSCVRLFPTSRRHIADVGGPRNTYPSIHLHQISIL